MFKYICWKRGSIGTGLNAADYVAGVQDIIDLGGESYPMDFYFNVFADGQALTQNGILL